MAIDRMAVYKKFDGHCAYCGREIEYKEMQVDHLQPKGNYTNPGTDDIENLTPSCRRCNHYKRANSLEYFRHAIETIPCKLMEREYIFKVAVDYGFFTPEKRRVQFYFEKVGDENNEHTS